MWKWRKLTNCLFVYIRSVEVQVWAEAQERIFLKTGWWSGEGATPPSPKLQGGNDARRWAEGTGIYQPTAILNPHIHKLLQCFFYKLWRELKRGPEREMWGKGTVRVEAIKVH